jgi:hypothetical protein
MAAKDELREARGRLDQATDNLLSDLQCPEERFLFLVRDYLAASGQYAMALLAARETVNQELGEAYEEDAQFFASQVSQSRFISILFGYRKRLGFGNTQKNTADGL